MNDDRYSFHRRMLLHMLTVQTPEGFAVVHAEALLRQFVEDLGAQDWMGTDPNDAIVHQIFEWAHGRCATPCFQDVRIAAHIDMAYRIMVGAFSYGYHPDWLCALPSKKWAHPDMPGWDRFGRRVA